MFVRHATLDDLEALASVEGACFPPKEAADIERLAMRVESFPQHFWLLVNPEHDAATSCFPAELEDGMLVSFINGMTTDDPDLEDAMFQDAQMHDESGSWQMILGVDTAPLYQHRGCAAYLMRRVILDCALNHRRGIVLTCKAKLVEFYEHFGFVDEGVSDSSHGGATWHQMRLVLDPDSLDAADAARFAHARGIVDESIRQAMEETTTYMNHDDVATAQFPVLR
ncbi:MAG: GNAT family N-acetyltransferase [Bifidobacterium sp.]|nr:GNAT family N-acetyltransferase [Bifidobacterium sp.]